jgi:hypothetical protein
MHWSSIRRKSRSEKPFKHSENNSDRVGVCSEKDFLRKLERERERANRNRHPFSLVVFEFDPARLNPDKTSAFLKQIITRMRVTDEIGWYDAKRIGIILPYTAASGARQFTKSLGDLMNYPIPISKCSICTYPPANDSPQELFNPSSRS